MTLKDDWPSREQWAEQRRTAYFDDLPTTSRQVSLYANEIEIAAAIAELKKLWSDYGRQMKAAAFTEDKHNFRYRRQDINEAIKTLRNGSVPLRSLTSPLLGAIIARYATADQMACDKYIAECAARPIDDAAWQEELERRGRICRSRPR